MNEILSSVIDNLHYDTTAANWVWSWLTNLVGPEAAQAIQIICSILVYGLIIYIDVIQIVRLITAIGNWNNENGGVRSEARSTVKSCFFIIAAVTIIGGVGFTAICFFMQSWLPNSVS